MSVTRSFARGQLEPLLCLHRAIRNKRHKSSDSIRSKFFHDLTNLATTILGDSTVGSHLSVLTDILDFVPEKELSVFVMADATLCSCGPVNGLARSSYSLASVATAYPT